MNIFVTNNKAIKVRIGALRIALQAVAGALFCWCVDWRL